MQQEDRTISVQPDQVCVGCVDLVLRWTETHQLICDVELDTLFSTILFFATRRNHMWRSRGWSLTESLMTRPPSTAPCTHWMVLAVNHTVVPPPPQYTRCFMVCLTLNDHNSRNEHQLFEEDLKLETETWTPECLLRLESEKSSHFL